KKKALTYRKKKRMLNLFCFHVYLFNLKLLLIRVQFTISTCHFLQMLLSCLQVCCTVGTECESVEERIGMNSGGGSEIEKDGSNSDEEGRSFEGSASRMTSTTC
ncbi:hypothetical protein L9F63_027382, partial [Diploptera punctata]